MTIETCLAFAPLEDRARSVPEPGAVPDRISLRDHVIEADIGAFQEERGQAQRLRFNVVVETRGTGGPAAGADPAAEPAADPADDDVDRILSYDRITEAIAAALGEGRLALLETLAARVAERVLASPQAARVFVRVEKLDRGPGALGVEIVRTRDAAQTAGDAERDPALSPVVAFLDNAAIADAGLSGRIDALRAQGEALVLAVGLPDAHPPRASDPAAQARIDLLAIEQNAWVLAARDPRCSVVATRTELDWSIANGRLPVWAPSKLVLDAVAGPGDRDPVALALWLAGTLGAVRLVVHGTAPLPADSRVEVVRAP